jgi:RNA polymerase sigma-70 factor (ECF subfamily)
VSHPEEHQWVRCAQDGDRAAFAALVDLHWPHVYRWLFSLTRHAHTAEDLAQEVFLKAWVKLRSFQAGTHFRAWLFRIAGNHFLDSRRVAPPACRQAVPEALAGREPDPVATLLSQETQTLVADAVARLPVELRAPLLLRIQEGLSFQEIGEAMKLTEGTARWRVFRARRLLLQALGSGLDGDRG